MAEGTDNISEKIEEDFLQCKVCFEVYRTPRTLPCLHSFCEACLKRMLDRRTGTVTCPECREVNDLQGNVHNAKVSLFINSLLDLLQSKTPDGQSLARPQIPIAPRARGAQSTPPACPPHQIPIALRPRAAHSTLSPWTSPLIPIAPRARAAQSTPPAWTRPKIPIAPRARGAQSTAPAWTPPQIPIAPRARAAQSTAPAWTRPQIPIALAAQYAPLAWTSPQIPIALAAQYAPAAWTSPQIPIALRPRAAQSVPPAWTPSPSSRGNQYDTIPSSLLFIRSFDTDDHDSPNHENITGLALCPSRDIIIADTSNAKIMRIIRSGQTRETIFPDERGWNVDPFSVAVCDENIFFTSGSVLFKVPENDCDDIVQVCNLRGSHQEYCIAAYEDEYIAVSEGVSCSLSLYSPSGMLVDRVNPDYEGKFVFLAVNRMEEFIVSDPVKKCVIILSRDGLILNICSTGSHSFYPRSVCVDKWNNIYVLEGKKILLFSPGGDFVRPLLTTSAYTPKLIAADERGHLVMVNKKGMVCIYRAVL